MDPEPSYDADYMVLYHRSVEFLDDPRFRAAYARGMDSGHHIARARGSREDLHIEWRVHVVLWAATHAAKLPGDFVECGVNTGIYSLAICEYLGFNSLDKSFWLFDTFAGIPEELLTDEERDLGRLEENAAWYSDCYAVAQRNFSPYPRAHLVRGRIPDVLGSAPVDRVAYLSLDLNSVVAETAAFEHFWDKLSPGAPIVLDDYGWAGFHPQKRALDALAADRGVEILTLPTGQGLILRPSTG